MYVSVLFTTEDLARIYPRIPDGEKLEETIHGIVMMVIQDLETQEQMDKEWWNS
jgi:hypothetical protein